MLSNLNAFLDKGTPDSIKESGNIVDIIRARVLSGLFFSTIVLCSVAFVVFLVVMQVSDKDFSRVLIGMGVSTLVLSFQFMVFRMMANVGISAIIFSMTYFGATLGVTIFTGGWHSPVMPLFMCSPAISFLVGGRNEGFYIFSLVFASGIAFFVANQMNFQIFQIIRPENMEIARMVVWVISLNILVSCLAVYDSLLRTLSRYKK